MSFISNQRNISINLEQIYLKIGSSWTLDSIYIFAIAPLGFFGVLSNIISAFIFFKIENSNFNIYLRAYSINGCFICFIGGILFIGYSPRYIPFFLDSFAQIIRCKLFTFVGPSLYMFGNILDIFISLERLSAVFHLANRITKLAKPTSVCLTFLIFSFLVNLPSYFVFKLRTNDEFIEDYFVYNVTFTYCGHTDFQYLLFSYPLFIVYIIVMFFRDILTLILEIIASSVCIHHYRKYEKLVRRIVRSGQTMNSTNNHIQRVEVGGKKLLKMTIWMGVLSIISHLIVFFTYLFPMISSYLLNSFINFYLICASIFLFGLKHVSNFLLFYLFNTNFRSEIKKLF